MRRSGAAGDSALASLSVIRSVTAVLVAASAVLALTACGDGSAAPSGVDVSMAKLTDATAEQSCIDLFGKASGIGAKFGEGSTFTWTAAQGGVADGTYLELSCKLTPVGGSARDTPLGILVTKNPSLAGVAANGSWHIWVSDHGHAWSDDQKSAINDLATKAVAHVTD